MINKRELTLWFCLAVTTFFAVCGRIALDNYADKTQQSLKLWDKTLKESQQEAHTYRWVIDELSDLLKKKGMTPEQQKEYLEERYK